MYSSKRPSSKKKEAIPEMPKMEDDGAMTINSFIEQFQNGTTHVTDQVSYDLKDVIDEEYRLYNSKFEESTDNTGLEKIFFNISWILYRTVFFSSDIDQKDLQMRAQNRNAVAVVALLRMAVENYLTRTHFGKTMDDIRAYMIAFGTAITKIHNGKPMLVDLRNIIRPPHIENLQESGICEKTFYTYEEIRAIEMDDYSQYRVRKMWEAMQKEGQYMFTVYEYWHEFDINGKVVKGCKRYLDCEILRKDEQKTNKSEWQPYLFLDKFKTPFKKRRTSRMLINKYGEYEDIYPYKQVNFIDVPGRWKGFGVLEIVKGLQRYYNEKWHLFRKKDILDLKGIYKHKKGVTNASLEQRFLDAVESGAVIDLENDEDIERLVTDMKTGEFIASVDKIMEVARQMVGVTAQGVGQDMPSTTTATVGVINQKTQQTTYDYVIERMSHFLTELFEDFYMATILEEISEEEMFYITGDPSELREIDARLVENQVNQLSHEHFATMGFYPLEENVEQWRDELLNQQETLGDTRFPELKKEVIKQIPFIVQFYVNNERFDKGVMIQNLTQLMQNPNFTGSREKLDEAILDLIGLSGRQFRKSKREQEAELQQIAAMEQAKAAGQPALNMPSVLGEGQQFGNASNPVSQTA